MRRPALALLGLMLIPAAALAIAAPAWATHITHFEFDGAGAYAGQTLVFDLPTSPTPTSFVDGVSFDISGVNAVRNAGADTAVVVDLRFRSAVDFAGFSATNPIFSYHGYSDGSAPQMYINAESAPSFRVGDYALVDADTGASVGTMHITALTDTVGEPPPQVPEPATMALLGPMLAGGLLGLAAARRRRAG